MMDLDFLCTSSSDRAGLLGVWTGSAFTVHVKQTKKNTNDKKADLTSLNQNNAFSTGTNCAPSEKEI